MGALELDLSGVGLRLSGLAPALARQIQTEWEPFVATLAGEPFLRVEVEYAGGAVGAGEWAPKRMRAELGRDAARYSMPEGSAEVDTTGRAAVRLAGGLGPREYYTLVNLLRACLAWRMPSRGGMLLHAAGLVLEQRAFLLAGAEGSGKSTWARIGEQSGGQVLSDDLVLVDGSSGQLEALGAPFRSTHLADYRPGRWPLAALLFPRKGSPAALGQVSDLIASARLSANLPFVSEGVGRDPRIDRVVSEAVDAVACAELTFPPDDSFVELLRSMPATPPRRNGPGTSDPAH